MTDDAVTEAIEAFRAGKPILVYDSDFRERETDLLWHASAATPKVIRQLRKDCGGLLFLALGDDVGDLYGLPYLQDLHAQESLVNVHPVLNALVTNDLQYDSRSAFTLSLNHRDTYTGITDRDRSLTTRRFSELSTELFESGATKEEAIAKLGDEFRTPGHIPLCREAPGGLSTRKGHTELAVAIARLAGLVSCTIGAEMLEPDGDNALPLDQAKAYGEARGIPFVAGQDLVEAMGRQ